MKNNQAKFLILSMLILLFNVSLRCNQAATLTMQEAVSLALEYRPSIQALEHILAAKQYDETLAWSGYFPSVTLSSRIQQQRRLPITGMHPSSTITSLEAQQLVYDPAGPQALAHLEKKRTDVLRYQQEQQRQTTQFAVELMYLECWQVQQQYASIASLHKSTEQSWKRSNHQHTVQLINKHEWLSAIESHTNNLSSVRQYYDTLASAAKQLMFLIGNSKPVSLLPIEGSLTTYLVWPKQNMQLKPLVYYQKTAQENHPEVQEAQKRVEESNELYLIASNSRLPKLLLNASAAHQSNHGFGFRGSHLVGATLQWNVFDQAKSDIKAAQAQAQKLASQLNKQEVAAQINVNVERAYYALSQDLTKLKATYFKYLRAKNEFVLRTKEHEVGTLVSTDYDQAKTAWQQVSFDWIAQKTTAAKKYRELLYKCGYPSKMMV